MAELPKLPENSDHYDNIYPHPTSETDLDAVRRVESLDRAQAEERRQVLYSRRSFLRTAGRVGMYSALAISGGMELLRVDTEYGEIFFQALMKRARFLQLKP